jgi:hypothetical protein
VCRGFNDCVARIVTSLSTTGDTESCGYYIVVTAHLINRDLNQLLRDRYTRDGRSSQRRRLWITLQGV